MWDLLTNINTLTFVTINTTFTIFGQIHPCPPPPPRRIGNNFCPAYCCPNCTLQPHDTLVKVNPKQHDPLSSNYPTAGVANIQNILTLKNNTFSFNLLTFL